MASFLRTMRRAEQSGSLYAGGAIATGAAAAAFYLVDRSQQQARERLAEELDSRSGKFEAQHVDTGADDVADDAAALWRGTIASASPGLMGDIMLRSARVGEAVEVLAEDVGPGQAYLRCRNPTTGAVGLYPMTWVRHPEKGTLKLAEGQSAC